MAAVAGTVGTVGAAVVAAVVTAPILLPAFTASTILGASLAGIGAATLSLVPAAANLLSGVSLRRTLDAIKGIKYDEAALKSKLDEDSVASNYYRREERDLGYRIQRLPEENQRTLFQSLKARFEKAAEKQEPQDETATVFAAPSSKPPATPKNAG